MDKLEIAKDLAKSINGYIPSKYIPKIPKDRIDYKLPINAILIILSLILLISGAYLLYIKSAAGMFLCMLAVILELIQIIRIE